MSPGTSISGEAHALKCEMAREVLSVSGSLRLQVNGWSMLPSVLPGDVLIVQRAASHEVIEGDIVLFGRDSRLFAHRVIGRKFDSSNILTRGDAMTVSDPPVQEKELLGKVTFILRNGRCLEPPKTLPAPQRAVAALVRHSEFAARMVVGIHGIRQASRSKQDSK